MIDSIDTYTWHVSKQQARCFSQRRRLVEQRASQHADNSDDDDDEQLTPTAASASAAASVPGAPAAADTPLRFVGTDGRLCLGVLRACKFLRELCASRSGRGW